MKKTLTAVAVSTALVLGGAAVASAAIELDGNVRVRGNSNHTGITKDRAPANAYDQKAQIGFKSKVSDELTGYIRLSTGEGSDNRTWGATKDGAATGSSKPSKDGMALDEAWIDYKPSNWGIKVGNQHIALAGNQFYDRRGDAPDSLINVYGDFAGTKIQAMMVKLEENITSTTTADVNNDDLDAYILTLDRKFNDQFTGSLNYTYLKGASDNYTPGNGERGLALSNLGAKVDLKFGDLSFSINGNHQFGDLRHNGTNSTDADGYSIQASADYKIGNSKVGIMFAQGSGDDNTADNDDERFVNYLFSTYRNNSLVGYAIDTPGAAKFGNNTGLSNLTIFQLNGSTSVTCPITGKPLSLFGALNFLQTTEDVQTTAAGAKEDDLGTEIHAKATWKLNSNLSYMVEGFYLWTDDAFNQSGGASGINANPTLSYRTEIDDAYWVRHGLTMKF